MGHADTVAALIQNRAERDATLLRHQLYDARLSIGYTIDLAALTAYAPAAEQLEVLLADPDVAQLLGATGEELDSLEFERLGWLIGASRPNARGSLGQMHWFHAPTYQGAMDAALQWARSEVAL
ncbi:hypothetical protein [Chitinimonas sp.]|uniref:hypothetical protein n=1 Tax=Chitinimonas sp. TaxID=1934313 RepID=UPI0035ADF855